MRTVKSGMEKAKRTKSERIHNIFVVAGGVVRGAGVAISMVAYETSFTQYLSKGKTF